MVQWWTCGAALLLAPWAAGIPVYNSFDPETAYQRDAFYTGGRYITDNVTQQVFLDGQMYVEKLTPTGGVKYPIPLVLLHGGGSTGALWLNTPDDRPGWASIFLDAGFSVYIVDSTLGGRSGGVSSQDEIPFRIDIATAVNEFTAPENLTAWPQAALHTQWPGTGMKGDATFDKFYASLGQFGRSAPTVSQQTTMAAAGIALLETIGPAILVGHGAGATYSWLIADQRRALVKAIVALEPAGPVFEDLSSGKNAISSPARKYGLTDIPMTFTPLLASDNGLATKRLTSENASASHACLVQSASPPLKLSSLAEVPVLVVTSEASQHATYDNCTVQFLKEAGVNVTWTQLGEIGIHGNGHYMMLEKNNEVVANVTTSWLGTQLGIHGNSTVSTQPDWQDSPFSPPSPTSTSAAPPTSSSTEIRA